MLIIINPYAGGGKARARWERIRHAVERHTGPFLECVAPDISTVCSVIRSALDSGETQFVAAGGDGTVNLVVNQLVELVPSGRMPTITLGAIALGSSNDFHKPTRLSGNIAGMPCRLDFEHPVPHDIGQTTYDDGTGHERVVHWILNASVGTTATGNDLYNRGDGAIGLAKHLSTSLAMFVAACAALFRSRGLHMTLQREDNTQTTTRVMNLGVVKNPYFTGCLKYDSPYDPGSGTFTVHLLAETSLWDTLTCLFHLARGEFSGQRKTSSWTGHRLAVEAPTPFAVEGDGEITIARRAVFSLRPRGLQVCP